MSVTQRADYVNHSLTGQQDRLLVVALFRHHDPSQRSAQRLPPFQGRAATGGPTCFLVAHAVTSLLVCH